MIINKTSEQLADTYDYLTSIHLFSLAMYVWILNLCVIACEFLSPNSTQSVVEGRHLVKDLNSLSHGQFKWIPPEWVNRTCSFCYDEWKYVYVQNASQYTQFLLYTRKSAENYTEIFMNDTQSLLAAGFNPKIKTKIVIHGWFNSGYGPFVKAIRNAYLCAENVNIISVNWSGLSFQFYTLAVTAVIPVGNYTAQLVDFLVNNVTVTPSHIHLVGHSLGAHVAGNAGEYVTSGKLRRITGLDPAGPLFTSNPNGRLDASDAKFVDVIHTCAGLLGYAAPLGTVDFYPNGGFPLQPGCSIDITKCAHRRSYVYFAESIYTKGFIGTACNSWNEYTNGSCEGNEQAIMGEMADSKITGVYYLHTHSSSPFAAWNETIEEDIE